ncbi:hypothetical protein VFPPC_17572 [Pochonia chlamydosporia 170]|uniref:Uncharacterized protein n=1 Tax=Pochonia chlamydosporia 170 TaxID=1380566 RepID=A0A219ASV2_METCM|nr:hypothetical protein VFPPC_17572 [Pochonia chlamydosporia 170]OWT43265.1 hypothetical protein VFPPC_17572 [Pochonia chlamydosporia 170]
MPRTGLSAYPFCVLEDCNDPVRNHHPCVKLWSPDSAGIRNSIVNSQPISITDFSALRQPWMTSGGVLPFVRRTGSSADRQRDREPKRDGTVLEAVRRPGPVCGTGLLKLDGKHPGMPHNLDLAWTEMNETGGSETRFRAGI